MPVRCLTTDTRLQWHLIFRLRKQIKEMMMYEYNSFDNLAYQFHNCFLVVWKSTPVCNLQHVRKCCCLLVMLLMYLKCLKLRHSMGYNRPSWNAASYGQFWMTEYMSRLTHVYVYFLVCMHI